MTNSERVLWWRGVGFGIALALVTLLVSIGWAVWTGNPNRNVLLNPLILLMGVQMICTGYEFRALENKFMSRMCFVLGILLLVCGFVLLMG